MIRVLLADDQALVRAGFRVLLESADDITIVAEAPNGGAAVALVRDNAKWEHAGQAYFSGEVEPCINGKAVAIGSYFGQDVSGIVDRWLGHR